MEKGLTIIDHESLCLAVENWKKLCILYDKSRENSEKYANEVWSGKPLLFRIWCNIKSGIFTPEEWWDGYSDYIKNNPIKGFQEGKEFLPKYCYTNDAMAAEDCQKHSLENGVHYLSPRQVSFVNTFKNLEIQGEL